MRSDWTAGQAFMNCVQAALLASNCRDLHKAAEVIYEASLIPDSYLVSGASEEAGKYGNFEEIPSRAAALVLHLVMGGPVPQFYKAFKS